ncbi:MAG: LuxR C-terminal-related transcriptional regulator [Allorhizobium sp.]|uniref:LuxR C-terminal-related transcriptional regulator n=1 Tax=Allorhizobium sp. TaxID=633478 RepID=UPI00403348CD
MPRNNMRLIHRPRLIQTMDRWLDIDLGVVSGPAGYAKSTAIAEWCRRRQSNGALIAWLSLDEADQEPAQFLSYLIAALSNAGVLLDGLETGAEEGFFAGGVSSALAAVIDALAQMADPVILVLDDYHRVNAPRIDDLFRTLVAAAPPNLTIVAATRTHLPFDIAGLLASGRADTLGSDALRFSKDELTSVFPDDVGEDAIGLLYERTEGWPVAVQLARLLVADGPARSRLENLHGHSGHIATYLAEKILSGLSNELQDFLCFTSPLERFNAELADAVMGRRVSTEMLARLEPLDALVVRAEGDETLYRYHHLFGEFLQTELRRRHGEDAVIDVHRRTSEWFEANGYMAQAVRHAREAGDLDRCAALVESAGGWELILFGGIGYLRGLLQQIPDAIAHSYPRILLAKAYLSLKDGLLGESRALFDAAANSRDAEAGPANLQRDLLNVGTLIFAYEDSPITTADLKRWGDQLERVPADDPLTRSILAAQLIVSELAMGQFAAADHRAQATMRTMREARTVLGLNYCYLHAGLAALYQGRLRAAEAHFGVARRMAEENFAFDPGLRALASLLEGSLRHWMGEPANYPVEQAEADLDQVEHYDGWLDIYAAGLAVEAFQLHRVEDAITRGQHIAERRGLRRLARMVDAVRVGMTSGGNRSSIAMKLTQQLPAEIWRQDPFWWLPFLESRLALSIYFAGIDRSKAIEALGEGLECARALGANIYTIRILVARALLLDLSGHRDRSIEDLIEALTMAAAERIVGPFLDQRGLASLLRTVVRQAQDSYIDILVLEFANAVIARYSKMAGENESSAAIGLSSREREVLEELASGRSNKEIARLLDMTEHTVKFHLKNIFGKLGAERRTEAVARARALKLI